MGFLFNLTRDLLHKFDAMSEMNLKTRTGNLYRGFLRILSLFRRKIDPLRIKLKYLLRFNLPKELKLNLGCGTKHFKGYVNVDIWISEATNVICDITKLPWPDNSASIIECYHVIEHISHKKISSVFKEWHRVLAPGGSFVIECPHFDNAVKEYFQGNEERLMNVFGRQRFPGDTHHYGYNPQRLIRLLQETGFRDFAEEQPTGTQTTQEPCFRLKCVK